MTQRGGISVRLAGSSLVRLWFISWHFFLSAWVLFGLASPFLLVLARVILIAVLYLLYYIYFTHRHACHKSTRRNPESSDNVSIRQTVYPICQQPVGNDLSRATLNVSRRLSLDLSHHTVWAAPSGDGDGGKLCNYFFYLG